MQLLPTPEQLRLIARLVSRETRAAASTVLATQLGAREMMVFIRDNEVDALLAAPGFGEPLPNGKAWRAFLDAAVDNGRHVGTLQRRSAEKATTAVGYAHVRDVVFVLLGGSAEIHDIDWFMALLPLLASVFCSERDVAAESARVKLARESAARAATLAQALDRTRSQLENALVEARQAREELERSNELLHHQAIEQEVITEQLQEQAIQMEAQTTELESQADELERARSVADAASRAKSDFLATMSHELRTPLNAIGGHVQLLSMGLHGPVTPAQNDSLERIERSARHLLGIINDILNLSRIESGRVDYAISQTPLAEVLAEIAPMIEPQLGAKGVSFEVRDRERWPTVCADRAKLAQILLNLLSNAVKFTDPGGRVWIDAGLFAEATSSAFLRVGDNGRGIPRDKLDEIFEPFMQVDASHSRLGQGTGLGLSISRDLARGMAGEISVTSELGAGSVFTVTLPVLSS